MVRGIERDGREIPERAGETAAVARPERIAVVLHHPQIVVPRQSHDGVQVEGDAHGVRHDDRPRLRADGFFERAGMAV